MKLAFLCTGLILLFASGAAQASPQNSTLSETPSAETLLASNVASNVATPSFSSVALLPPDTLPAISAAVSPIPVPGDPMPQRAVISVRHPYKFQAYAGYTFVRVYSTPAREVNRNGFDISMSYFFHNGIFGVEGGLTTTFGSIGNEKSDFVFAGGGPRVRWAAPRGLEIWAHGLVGGANFGPSISGYTQSALAYELGGGVDITAHFQRLAYRVEADMIGTRLYDTSQYSPKFSVGLVYKF